MWFELLLNYWSNILEWKEQRLRKMLCHQTILSLKRTCFQPSQWCISCDWFEQVFKPEMKCSRIHFTGAQDHPFQADQRAVLWSTPEFKTTNRTYEVHTPGFGSNGQNKAAVHAS